MSIKPINLYVNSAPADKYSNLASPLHFSWGNETTGESQTSFQIKIFNKSYSYDSGIIYSSDTFFEFEKILSEGKYNVLLIINEISSVKGSFRIVPEILTGSKWITAKKNNDTEPIYFIKHFQCEKNISDAILYICGIGLFKAFLNGENPDDGVLQPVFSNFSRQNYYVTLDVKEYIKKGKNSLAVKVGDGWRRNYGEYCKIIRHQIEFFGAPQLISRLEIKYDDGTEENILSDESFSVLQGGTVSSNLFNGETYDANMENPNWKKPNFDLSSLEKAVLGENLPLPKPQNVEPIKINKILYPISITYTEEDTYILDFGENIAGYAEIKIPPEIKKGDKIQLRFSEELDLDGNLCMDTMREAKSTDTYISNGCDGGNLWSPDFVYHGFRYVELKGWKSIPSDTDIKAFLIYSDVDNKSFFSCGSALVNQIQENIVRTERDNLHGIATDCPQRDERMGWLNDATVRFEEIEYNFNVSRLFPKIIQDIEIEQDKTGAIPCTVPYIYGRKPTDPVCSSYLIAGYMTYLHYGNIDIIKKYYQNFKEWNECLKNLSDNGIVNYTLYGDWAGPADTCIAMENPHSKITPGELMSTGYHYYNYKLLAKFAEILNNNDEKEFNEKEAERVRRAFLDKWWNEETGVVATGSQGCQAFSLWLGILPEGGREKAAKRLYEAVEKADFAIAAGNLTARYVMDMLCEYGYTDAAWKIITREKYPSFGFMIQEGATTIWERFEQKECNNMNSHNHPMYGAVGSWFYSHIAGLIPTDKGWSKFTLKPHIPKDLTFAHAELDTVKGKAGIKWFKRYGKLNIHIKVPYGSQCKFIFKGEEKLLNQGFYKFHYDLED